MLTPRLVGTSRKRSGRKLLNKNSRPRIGMIVAVVAVLSSFGIFVVLNSKAATQIGDLNGDGVVNVFDLSILLSAWGTTNTNIEDNLSRTGPVDIFDLSILLSHWGQTGSTPTPTPTPAPGCANGGVVAPCVGSATTGAGGWGAPVFEDEFNGTSVDTSRWTTLDGWSTNNVTVHTSNVAVSGGNLLLTLASSSSGAEVDSYPADGAGPNGYSLPVGGFVEARVYFPGNGTTIYNWPAFWISGPNWPAAGESDVAEGLGTLTVNYHSPSGAHNQGTIPGVWSNAFHTYGLYRASSYCDVYWDGQLVKQYPTDDNGQPEAILINVGAGNQAVYGTASQIKVDYVRAWQK